MDEKVSGKKLTTQSKLIVAGMALSTLFIALLAYFAIFEIEHALNSGYRNFASIISKTLAIESEEITKDIPDLEKYETLRNHSKSILKNNTDISYVEFRDKNTRLIYSSKDDFPSKYETDAIKASAPLKITNLGQVDTTGSVMVGLSGKTLNKIVRTAKASMIFVFILAWVVILGIVYMNTSIISRELRKLYNGVKKISSGDFGYKIENENADKEVAELFDAFNDMSAKLSRYNEQTIESLTFERNKLEAVLMSIVNGVVVCDSKDKVILINNHAKKLLEVADADILNTQIQQFCDTNGELCFKDKIEQFKDTPLEEMETKPLEFNIEISKRIIKSLISPMFTRSGAYTGYIIVLIDVTKEIEMDQLRSHFISNVSHELRTPVTVLRSYIDTLYNYGDNFDFNTQREFIGVMNQEIIRLNRMVNDILDFSRYESQNVHLEMSKQNIVEIIEDCVNQVEVLAKEHNLTFSIIKEPDLPEVMLNIDSISRALMNIISNAIKYSPDGKRIKIRAERSRVENCVEVSVEDQGPGIPEECLDKIFERFYRVENATHSVKGTGLGLHLVKIAIEKHHHGQVFVTSKLGEGSTFGFRLPIDQPEEEREEYIPKLPSESETEQSSDGNNWSLSIEKK